MFWIIVGTLAQSASVGNWFRMALSYLRFRMPCFSNRDQHPGFGAQRFGMVVSGVLGQTLPKLKSCTLNLNSLNWRC